MKHYEFQNNGFTFIRIPKNKARVAYNNGLTVIFCPCNLRPFGFWPVECDIKKDPNYKPFYPGDLENTFDFKVNVFERYNCTDSETGKYTAFYIPVKRDKWYTDERLRLEYDYSYMTGGEKHETE